MANLPEHLKYTAAHAWVLDHADGTVSVGITDHAQETLGDLVFVELPAIGAHVAAEARLPSLNPSNRPPTCPRALSGTVTEINTAVVDNPELVNQDAYAAWLFKLHLDDPAELEQLLSAAACLNTTT